MRKEWIPVIIMGVIIIVGLYFLMLVPAKSVKAPTIEKGLVITNIKAGDEISSPLKITGYVNGDGWSGFEGQVGTVKLLDEAGNELAATYLPATTEWMKLPTNFEANMEFQSPKDQNGTLVFMNENASGLPENGREFRLPVIIKKTAAETMIVKAYFNNSQLDPENSCNKVFPAERQVAKTEGVARAALEELLKGPTEAEKLKGFITSINQGVSINSIKIANGTATVDFDEQLEYQVGGSCRVNAIRAQIIQTLEQFPTIKSVIISINGRTEDILQP
jgi:hypothetical protein